MVLRPGGQHDVIIIGGGLAGLSAAHYAARCGARAALMEKGGLFGGQVATVEHLDGLPAAGTVSGSALAADMADRCRSLGVRIIEAEAERLTANAAIEITASGGGQALRTKSVIIASGAALRTLDVPGATDFLGRGVSQCASCDGPLFRDENVVVVGGGDAAAQEALVLSEFCRSVAVVCRSPLKAKRRYIDALSSNPKVGFIWDSELDAILGDGAVTSVRLKNRKDGNVTEHPCAAVFPFIGTVPNSRFAPQELLDSAGYVETDVGMRTKHPRVFAAGAVRRGYGGQAAQAVAEGVSAASAALKAL